MEERSIIKIYLEEVQSDFVDCTHLWLQGKVQVQAFVDVEQNLWFARTTDTLSDWMSYSQFLQKGSDPCKSRNSANLRLSCNSYVIAPK
jgi:hypothetical protein